jgi:pimeloyl-ACP methyl ester carboxylesterase
MERRDLAVAGTRLACFEAGQGEPVLLLHGYPQNHDCWRQQIAGLSPSHRVIAPDWFGWGASEKSLLLKPAYDAEVERIGFLLDALQLDRVNLITHDYGGFLGLGFVQRHAHRVRRFAIMNSRAHRTFPQPYYGQFAYACFMGRWPVLRTLLCLQPVGEIHRLALRRYVRKGCFDQWKLAQYTGWMDTWKGRRWYAHFFAHYELPVRAELAAGLDGIACPTAVIWGDRDPYCPFSTAEDLAARIPGAALVRVAGADHYVMEERPDEVLGAIQALLARPAN